MKKFIILTVVVLTTCIAVAQPQYNQYAYNNYGNQNASLVLTSASITRDYVVNINNRQSYLLSNGNNTATVQNVFVGNQSIEVYKIKNRLFGGQTRELIYNGVIQVRRGFETTVSIDMFDRVNVNDRQVYFDNHNGGWNNGNGNGCGNGNNGNGGWNNGNGCGNGNGWGRKKNKHKQQCGTMNGNSYSNRNVSYNSQAQQATDGE